MELLYPKQHTVISGNTMYRRLYEHETLYQAYVVSLFTVSLCSSVTLNLAPPSAAASSKW